jgi:hypothetical protein
LARTCFLTDLGYLRKHDLDHSMLRKTPVYYSIFRTLCGCSSAGAAEVVSCGRAGWCLKIAGSVPE